MLAGVTSIAIIGTGAVGGYYGGLLARAGHDVRFLMRRDLEAVRERGLDIRSPGGDFVLSRPAVFAAAEDIGAVDWVICSLKATALSEARALVSPCVGPQTRILVLMNGLGIEEQFGEWFGRSRVFGGMAFVCINRGEPGVIHHLDYGRVSIGHLEDDAAQLRELQLLLESGGIEVASSPNLRYARWEKLCWNIPFNGLSVAGGGIGTRLIVEDEALRQTAEQAMREVVSVANADLAELGSRSRLDVDEVVRWMFLQTDSMGDYRTSMALDYVAGRPLEVEAILGEAWRRAKQLGVPTPTLAALYSLVRVADLRRRGLIQTIPTE